MITFLGCPSVTVSKNEILTQNYNCYSNKLHFCFVIFRHFSYQYVRNMLHDCLDEYLKQLNSSYISIRLGNVLVKFLSKSLAQPMMINF